MAGDERLRPPPPLLVTPPVRRRSSPAPPPVSLATTSASPCTPPLPRSGPASPRRLAPPPLAVAVRAHRASPATPWPRPRRGQGACPALTRLGGPLASGPHPSAPAVWDPGAPSSLLGFFIRFIYLQSSKNCRNSCIAPKMMKPVLLDSSR